MHLGITNTLEHYDWPINKQNAISFKFAVAIAEINHRNNEIHCTSDVKSPGCNALFTVCTLRSP